MITSLSNERIKSIRRLKVRKYRSETGLFLVEGIRLVIEAIEQNAGIQQLIIAPNLLRSEVGLGLIKKLSNNIEIIEVSDEVFQSLSNKDGPHGLSAVIQQQIMKLETVHLQKGFWVALDAIADPGNLGSILRTTEAAGGEGIILMDQTTDPYDPTSIRASMGAVFDVKIIRTSLAEFASWKKEKRIMVVGTDGESDRDYRQITYPEPLVIMMGSERTGLLPAHYSICDVVVKIPMVGKSDSLNLATATGIMIYEIFDQWHPIAEGKIDIHYPG